MPKLHMRKQGRSRLAAGDLAGEIERISRSSIDDLRRLWRKRYDHEPPPALTKDLLARALCHAIQEAVQGGLSAALRKRLRAIATRGKIEPASGRHLKPGSILVREHQGTIHQVVVIPDGFLWQEKTYASLSAIAREITGTTWNGPRFFGLDDPSKTAKQGGVAEAGDPASRSMSTRVLPRNPRSSLSPNSIRIEGKESL